MHKVNGKLERLLLQTILPPTSVPLLRVLSMTCCYDKILFCGMNVTLRKENIKQARTRMFVPYYIEEPRKDFGKRKIKLIV